MDIDDPHLFGALSSPENYMEFRYKMQEAMVKAEDIIIKEGNIIVSYGQLGAGMTSIMLFLVEKEYRSRKNESMSNL